MYQVVTAAFGALSQVMRWKSLLQLVPVPNWETYKAYDQTTIDLYGDLQKAKLFNNTIQPHFFDIPLHQVILGKADWDKQH